MLNIFDFESLCVTTNRVIRRSSFPTSLAIDEISARKLKKRTSFIITSRSQTDKNKIRTWLGYQFGNITCSKTHPANFNEIPNKIGSSHIHLIFKDVWDQEIRDRFRIKNISDPFYKTYMLKRIVSTNISSEFSIFDNDYKSLNAYYLLSQQLSRGNEFLDFRVFKSNGTITTQVKDVINPMSKKKAKVSQLRKPQPIKLKSSTFSSMPLNSLYSFEGFTYTDVSMLAPTSTPITFTINDVNNT